MDKLGDLVIRVRSKNAGPFWVTVDIFCKNLEQMNKISTACSSERIARLVAVPESSIKRFEIPYLSVIKISFPRPHPQGSLKDRDMHGAQTALLFETIDV